MKTKSLQVRTHVHAQPATRSRRGVEPQQNRCPEHALSRSEIKITLCQLASVCWKWDTFRSQSGIWISQGKLMKRETGVQFSQHSCHGANMSGSGVRASRVLGHCTDPYHQLTESCCAQQPSLCQCSRTLPWTREALMHHRSSSFLHRAPWLILRCSTSRIRRM